MELKTPACPKCGQAYSVSTITGRLTLVHQGVWPPEGCEKFAPHEVQWTFENTSEARVEYERLAALDKRKRARQVARENVQRYSGKTSGHGKRACLGALAYSLRELGIDPGDYFRGNWDLQVDRLKKLIPAE